MRRRRSGRGLKPPQANNDALVRGAPNHGEAALDHAVVTFKWKDYWIKGRDWFKTMTLDAAAFTRRFVLRVLLRGSAVGAVAVRSAGAAARIVRPIRIALRSRLLTARAVGSLSGCRCADSPAARRLNVPPGVDGWRSAARSFGLNLFAVCLVPLEHDLTLVI